MSPTGTSAGFNQRPGWVPVSAASREAPALRSSRHATGAHQESGDPGLHPGSVTA